ncbi:hypothetical protein CDEF62S_02759 [Castellaniella defragrans]
MLLVQTLRLLRHAILDIHEHLDVLLQKSSHHALHGVAIEANDLRQGIGGKHGDPAGFLFENDLQQDAAG